MASNTTANSGERSDSPPNEAQLVQLYIYELTQGLARTFAPLLLGKSIFLIPFIYHLDFLLPLVENLAKKAANMIIFCIRVKIVFE